MPKRTTTRLMLFAFLSLLVTSSWAGADDGPAPAVAAPWLLYLDYEHYPRPGSPDPKGHIRFGFAEDGRFSVALRQETSEKVLVDTTKAGVLTGEELDFLLQNLKNVDLAAMAGAQMDIGYGADLTPGWQGTLTYASDGSPSVVRFSSRRATGQDRTIDMNRLVTLIFDLRRMAEGKALAAD